MGIWQVRGFPLIESATAPTLKDGEPPPGGGKAFPIDIQMMDGSVPQKPVEDKAMKEIAMRQQAYWRRMRSLRLTREQFDAGQGLASDITEEKE